VADLAVALRRRWSLGLLSLSIALVALSYIANGLAYHLGRNGTSFFNGLEVQAALAATGWLIASAVMLVNATSRSKAGPSHLSASSANRYFLALGVSLLLLGTEAALGVVELAFPNYSWGRVIGIALVTGLCGAVGVAAALSLVMANTFQISRTRVLTAGSGAAVGFFGLITGSPTWGWQLIGTVLLVMGFGVSLFVIAAQARDGKAVVRLVTAMIPFVAVVPVVILSPGSMLAFARPTVPLAYVGMAIVFGIVARTSSRSIRIGLLVLTFAAVGQSALIESVYRHVPGRADAWILLAVDLTIAVGLSLVARVVSRARFERPPAVPGTSWAAFPPSPAI
jgi:hypothetical protein